MVVIEYSALPDRREEVPDLIPYLRPEEKVIDVQHVPTPRFGKLPAYREELAKLCGVDRPEEIGRNGPAIAARSAQQTTGQGLFECRFGRDGLIVAMNVYDEFPALLPATVLDYARFLGIRRNRQSEEEFGRLFHEARNPDDPVAQKITKESGWEWPFYASVDATLLFLKAIYLCQKEPGFLGTTYLGRDGQTHTLQEAKQFALQWVVGRTLLNPEGFVEYWPAFPESHLNQVMEDSYDSHFHTDGQLPNFAGGIASTEVQGLAYDVLNCAEQHGDITSSFHSRKQKLAEHIATHLWIEDDRGGYFAVGTDRNEYGQLQTMRIRKAIPNFLLESSLLESPPWEERITAAIRTIFSPALLGATGLRSLAFGEARYKPGAYHNGSSWPMQTFGVAEGLRTQGYPHLAAELDRRIVAAIETVHLYPEYFKGEPGMEVRLNERIVDSWDPVDCRTNRIEQPPQQIQAWTLSAYGAIKFRAQQGIRLPPPLPLEEEILSTLAS